MKFWGRIMILKAANSKTVAPMSNIIILINCKTKSWKPCRSTKAYCTVPPPCHTSIMCTIASVVSENVWLEQKRGVRIILICNLGTNLKGPLKTRASREQDCESKPIVGFLPIFLLIQSASQSWPMKIFKFVVCNLRVWPLFFGPCPSASERTGQWLLGHPCVPLGKSIPHNSRRLSHKSSTRSRKTPRSLSATPL